MKSQKAHGRSAGGISRLPFGAVDVTHADPVFRKTYSVSTLVSEFACYEAMVASFRRAGFNDENTEFLFINNTNGNSHDAYSGLNRMLAMAIGRYAILCHQDIIVRESESDLGAVIDEMNRSHPDWAVLSNVGVSENGRWAGSYKNLAGESVMQGTLPAPVASVDEHFVVLKSAARIGFSRDIGGFHMYGTDIVTQAGLAGWRAYAIRFMVTHLGHGRMGREFDIAKASFERKYRLAMRPRHVRTTVTRTKLGGSSRLGDALRNFRHAWRTRRKALSRFLTSRLEIAMWRLGLVRYEVDGIRFEVPASATPIARKAIRRGIYEKPERDLVRKWLTPGVPVIELGGSYGIVSRLARRHVGESTPYHVVEANPQLIGILRRNSGIAADGDSASVVNAAISYAPGETVSFVVTSGTHDSRVASPGHPGNITVRSITLGGLLRQIACNGEYALICDIEGLEYDLLATDTGALKKCRTAVVEAHPVVFAEQDRSLFQFERLIEQAGFEVVDTINNVYALKRRSA